ncbi:MAG: hypothetical protein AB8B91_18440 [Rubripirellula sp.]
MAVKRRRGDDDDDGGLDSLLDTMTNVVGILVLVLIVTQMSISEVVSRITAENTIDEAELEKLSQQLEIKRAEVDELEQILVDPLDIDAEKQREELAKKKELLDRRKKELAKKKQEQNEFSMRMAEDRKLAEKNKQQIADTEAKRDELRTLITTSQERKEQLEAMLDKTPRVAAPADVQVSIPNPRPAPTGAKQFILVCADDRLHPVNVDYVRKDAEQKVKAIIARYSLDRDPAKGIDPAAFAKHYEKLKEQDEFFNIEYFVERDRYPRIRFIPREGRGASSKEVANPRSRVRTKYLSQVDVSKYYARFYVLPDSYGVYMTSRRLFANAGMLAGWDPQSEGWQLTSWVPGGIELGPPREKPPPRPPQKPANLID